MMNKPKCYTTHKHLETLIDKTFAKVYGGNGYNPLVKADLYIDLNPRKGITPFEPYPTKDGGQYINFPILNMQVPNINKLRMVLDVMYEYGRRGKSIHVGCIGGHGRTGLVLVAYFAFIQARKTGEIDPTLIKAVRDNYCEKAVESQAQVDYLVHHFDQEPVEPRCRITTSNWVNQDL